MRLVRWISSVFFELFYALYSAIFLLSRSNFPNFINKCSFLVRSPFRFANRFSARVVPHERWIFRWLARARFSFYPLNVRYGSSVLRGSFSGLRHRRLLIVRRSRTYVIGVCPPDRSCGRTTNAVFLKIFFSRGFPNEFTQSFMMYLWVQSLAYCLG